MFSNDVVTLCLLANLQLDTTLRLVSTGRALPWEREEDKHSSSRENALMTVSIL